MRYIALLTALIINLGVTAQPKLQTIAESSDFKSTSEHRDVMAFIKELVKTSPYIRTENIAVSVEGREIPLLIIGNPLPSSPQDLKGDKRIVVYIQANIHAGEVEGKEAVLMYARDLLKEKNPAVLKNVVLLICPDFNPDGNDKISRENRSDQNGPENGVGVRYNGQSLDLNRDAMKAESPEVRGVLKNVFNRWDPSIFMDCHTTDGSFHVEPVTFTWMVNPNGSRRLINYMKDMMMPAMSESLSGKYKVENCFYGEFIDMLNPEKGWILDASDPRYMSNYVGLRNRLGILNENYVYAPYRDRVYGCYYLIHSLMEYAAGHSTEIKSMLSEADAATASGFQSDSFAIEYKVRPLDKKVKVRTYEAELVKQEGAWPEFRNTGRQIDVTIPYLIDWEPARSVKVPYAYILSVKDPAIIETLRNHGVIIEKLATPADIPVQRFDISALKAAERLNQGHHSNTISGKYTSVNMSFPEGTIIVKTSQPLARLAAYLLEPQSNDGFAVWNFFDRYLVPQWGSGYNPFPVYKLMEKTEIRTVSY
ncbi:MAG TPA: M14 family metallopeptidase [Bacteroidales bacterium]|nr:M14 family metallopeptidase [Bacteroidales bacterium]